MHEPEMSWIGDQGPRPITNLPNEIWKMIFNKLEQSEIYKLRLICQQWNEIIKDSFNFAIKLNEDSRGLDFILQLHIAELEVKKLSQNRFRILPAEVLSPATEADEGLQLRSRKVQHPLTFKYPNCIRRITIDQSSNMSPKYLHQFLQLFQKSLRRLDLDLNYNLTTFQSLTPLIFQFQNLKRLDLSFRIGFQDLWNNSVLSILQASQFPSLKSLKITVDEDNISLIIHSTTGLVLRLLTMNPKGMEQLSLFFYPEYFRYLNNQREPMEVVPKLSTTELTALKTVTNLKWIDLNAGLENFGPHTTNMDLLLELIPRQEKLEKFNATRGFKCCVSLLNSIMINNYETIVDVNIEYLNVNSDTPFDISILKNCHRLKRLTLQRNYERSFPRIGAGPEFINCDSFPAALTYLSFQNIRILSRDILAFLSSDLMLTLEELTLGSYGDSGNCGLNYAVLEKIEGLETKKLRSITLNGLNSSGTKPEVRKMKAVMKRLGVGDSWVWMHSNICLVPDNDNPDNSWIVNRARRFIGNER